MRGMPEITIVLNNIRRCNIKEVRGFDIRAVLCSAMIEYYKTLEAAGAIKRSDKVMEDLVDQAIENATKEIKENEAGEQKPVSKMNKTELLLKCAEMEIEANPEMKNNELRELIMFSQDKTEE